MAWFITDLRTGAQPIADTSTVALHKLGETVKAVDPTYGEGEFIYLQGIGSTIVGAAAVYSSAFLTALTVAASRGAVGVAMSVNVASQYGWYQIRGLAVTKSGTVASGGPLQATATPGEVDDTTTAGQYIDGAVAKTANGTPAAGFIVANLSYPCMNGR